MKSTQLSISELFSQSLSDAVGRPTIHNYEPHAKQLKFHKSVKKVKLYIGGNRSGKTVGGAAEAIYWMKGEHPFRRGIPQAPTRGRIVTVSRIEGINQLIIPQLKRWLPPSLLQNGSWEDSYDKTEFLLTLSNGSTVQLMTYEQSLQKFAGDSLNWVWCDEEPPNDIYKECRMRLMDTGGSIWLTMTPVEGMTWVYEDLYIPGLSGDNPGILVVIIDTDENPYISQEQKNEVYADLDEDELKARKRGEFVHLGGLVYKSFNPDIHVVSEIDPAQVYDWNQYTSMDHGLNNPTCWLWHAVHPTTGFVVTFDELYINETTVKDIADLYHERCRRPGRRYPDKAVGDPSIQNRSAVDKLSIQKHYAMAGVSIALGNNNIDIGVEKVDEHLKGGIYAMTMNCINLRREMARLRWKVYENAKKRRDNNPRPEIHKKNDHAPDALRYFMADRPDLRIPVVKDLTAARMNAKVQAILGARTYRTNGAVYDENVIYRGPSNTEWTVVDEHMGGYY